MTSKLFYKLCFTVLFFKSLQDDILYHELGFVLEHIRRIRLYEQDLQKFEETRRIQKENLAKVLISIKEQRGFTLNKIPRECVNERRNIYNNFGPRSWPVWCDQPKCHKKLKYLGWASKPSVSCSN